MNATADDLRNARAALGDILTARGLHYEVVAIGGGNLIVRGLVSRPTTKDLDLLGEWTPDGLLSMRPMPPPFQAAIADVGRSFGLALDWVNLGPDSLLDFGLPDGFAGRLEVQDFGGLVVWWAGRYDMVCFKLHAVVDMGPRSPHLQDLRELGPSRDEILSAARWARTYDPSPAYRSELVAALVGLGIEDADGDLE